MLRSSLLVLLLGFTSITPAYAEGTTSTVDSVVVFPRGAEVTRSFTENLSAGEHELVLTGLPGNIDPASLRISGSADKGGLKIGAVDFSIVKLDTDNDSAREKLQASIDQITDDIQRQKQTIKNAQLQTKLLQSMLMPGRESPDVAVQLPSQDTLAQLLELSANKLQAFSEIMISAKSKIRDNQKQLQALQRLIANLGSTQNIAGQVTVKISSQEASTGQFKLSYLVQNAGWQPVYEARLTLGADDERKLTLVRKAIVRQQTSTAWKNVTLTLSTSRPGTATAAPKLRAQYVGPMPTSNMYRKTRAVSDTLSERMSISKDEGDSNQKIEAAPMANEPVMAQTEQATSNISGLQATFKVPGKITIGNEGAAKQVSLSEDEVAIELSAITVPRVNPVAYLNARFKVPGAVPILPGKVAIFRDGVYFGQGHMPLVAADDEHDLGIGADDQIKVEYQETARESGEEGILVNESVETLGWQIKLTNLHNFPIKLRILDQMPVSTHEDVKVTLSDDATSPDEKDADDVRGAMAWKRTLDGGEKAEINFGYRIASPAGIVFSTGVTGLRNQ